MSTEKRDKSGMPADPVGNPVSMRELSEILVKHYGLNSGRYDLLVEFQIGLGAVGPNKQSPLPGAMFGISKVGLIPSQKDGATTVDAALVNPPKKARKRSPKAPNSAKPTE